MNQYDLPKSKPEKDLALAASHGLSVMPFETTPVVDYTPPAYITLLFTDLGVLTSSGVSDSLSKLIQNSLYFLDTKQLFTHRLSIVKQFV